MNKTQIIALAILIGMFARIDCVLKLSQYQNSDYQLIDEKIELKPLKKGQLIPAALQGEPIVTTEDIKRDYFTSNAVITLVTQQMNEENNAIIETTRVFQTKNPTIFTWSNAALATGALAVMGAGVAYANGVTLENINNIPDYLRYGMTTEEKRNFNNDKLVYEERRNKKLTPQEERYAKELEAYNKKVNKKLNMLPEPSNGNLSIKRMLGHASKEDYDDYQKAWEEYEYKLKELRENELKDFIKNNPHNTIAAEILDNPYLTLD